MKNVRTAGTLGSVPNQPKNKHRQFRLDDDDWDDFGAAASSEDTDRSHPPVRPLVAPAPRRHAPQAARSRDVNPWLQRGV